MLGAIDLTLNDVLTLGLTVVLIGLTFYASLQARRTVVEMQSASADAITPRLALRMVSIGPMNDFVEVRNVSGVAALDVSIVVRFVPLAAGPPETRSWRASTMLPGEHEQIMFEVGGQLLDTKALVERYDRIELRGSMRDIADNEHAIRHELPNLKAWLEGRHTSHLRWEHPDAEHRFGKQLEERVGKELKKIDTQLRVIAERLR